MYGCSTAGDPICRPWLEPQVHGIQGRNGRPSPVEFGRYCKALVPADGIDPMALLGALEAAENSCTSDTGRSIQPRLRSPAKSQQA